MPVVAAASAFVCVSGTEVVVVPSDAAGSEELIALHQASLTYGYASAALSFCDDGV